MRENCKIHSKTKSKNHKVLFVYDYLLRNNYNDSDFWYLGGGSGKIQERLNDFDNEDWEELKIDIFNWEELYMNILLDSIPYGFDDSFSPFLSERVMPNAGNFLLDIFLLIDDFDIRYEIAYFSSFIKVSKTKQLEKLEFMKNWMLNNGFNTDEWLNSKMNPLGNIETAIKAAIS